MIILMSNVSPKCEFIRKHGDSWQLLEMDESGGARLERNSFTTGLVVLNCSTIPYTNPEEGEERSPRPNIAILTNMGVLQLAVYIDKDKVDVNSSIDPVEPSPQELAEARAACREAVAEVERLRDLEQQRLANEKAAADAEVERLRDLEQQRLANEKAAADSEAKRQRDQAQQRLAKEKAAAKAVDAEVEAADEEDFEPISIDLEDYGACVDMDVDVSKIIRELESSLDISRDLASTVSDRFGSRSSSIHNSHIQKIVEDVERKFDALRNFAILSDSNLRQRDLIEVRRKSVEYKAQLQEDQAKFQSVLSRFQST